MGLKQEEATESQGDERGISKGTDIVRFAEDLTVNHT
jgi:hypothetical protein